LKKLVIVCVCVYISLYVNVCTAILKKLESCSVSVSSCGVVAAHFRQRISVFWAQRRGGVGSRVESTPTRARSNTVLSNLELPGTYGRIFMARMHRIFVMAERETMNSQLSVRFAPIGAIFYDRIQDQCCGLKFKMAGEYI
jgi:hypothetical protein